jgi:hypothetical protein
MSVREMEERKKCETHQRSINKWEEITLQAPCY